MCSRRHLIDRLAQVNVGSGRFLRPHAREQRGIGSRMIARAIGPRLGIMMCQPGDDLNLLLDAWRATSSSH